MEMDTYPLSLTLAKENRGHIFYDGDRSMTPQAQDQVGLTVTLVFS